MNSTSWSRADNFKIDHSHNMGQYPDGMRGLLIVDDPQDPFAGEYDVDYTISVSDWYDGQSLDVVRGFLTADNPAGLLPLPDAALINDGASREYAFDPSKTYRLRIVSFSTLAAFMIQADGHPFTVIMADSAYVDSPVVNQLRLTPGQRYDVLIRGSDGRPGNFPIIFSMDRNKDWTMGSENESLVWPLNATAYFVSDAAAERPVPNVGVWNPEDEVLWHTYGKIPRLPKPDHRFFMEFTQCLDAYGIPR